MKMMRKNWKSRSAVSPVIATILMVAITVVLAAVLYVMVMGFGDDSASTPAGQITKVEETSTAGTFKLTLSSFSPSTKFTDLKVSIDGAVVTTGFTWGDLAGDDVVSQGDSLTVTNAAGKTISIVHGPSGGLIAERTLPGA